MFFLIIAMALLGLIATDLFVPSLPALAGSQVVRYLSSYHLVIVGLCFLLVSGLLLILTEYCFGTHLVIIIPLLFLVTMAGGLLFPHAFTLAFSQIHMKIGIAGAIYGCSQILVTVLVNLILNMLTHQNQTVLGIFYVLMGAFGLMLILRRKGCVD